ncbi:hypothetical protein B0H11DRAFT_2203087 [Mycena galericulata]|nr:hypothetical protein B0H11DRAFT_2203087 [Mycena galericulata]
MSCSSRSLVGLGIVYPAADIFAESSGFINGGRMLAAATSETATSEVTFSRERPPLQDASLSRHGTLLTSGASPVKRAAELKSLLGNANARLRSGALLSQHPREPTVLEQAKPRARVEIDIVLHSNVFVEGGIMKGLVKLRIRPRLAKESAVSISDGKLRIIGFEAIEGDHHEFFQYSAALSAVVTSPLTIYKTDTPPDSEGFSMAREGVHRLEFEMHLPMHGSSRPKGPFHSQSGVAVRYIALVSIKIKDELSKRSIAHFYRDCEVWPRLNPSVVLAPAEQCIRATTSKTLFMGGDGEVKLTAALHRSHFIAGTQVSVHFSVQNNSKKLVKRLTLTLYRYTTVFKWKSCRDIYPDPCQSTTTRKSVATSSLEMAQGFPRGHASTSGWWAGVAGGEGSEFSHLLLIPPDALTHTLERLLEVQYAITVTLSTGSKLTSDVSVTLPIRIINLLSLDPPTTFTFHPESEPQTEVQNTAPIPDADECQMDHTTDLSNEGECQYPEEDPGCEADLGNLSMCEDAEDLVQHAIVSAQTDNCSGITHQLLGSIDGNLYHEAGEQYAEEELQHTEDSNTGAKEPGSRSNRLCGPSSFAMRVQKKLQVAASARQSPVPCDQSPEACKNTSSVSETSQSTATHTSNPCPGVPSVSAISYDPGYQAASSSFLDDRYFASSSPPTRPLGSRLLPQPPSIVGLPFPETTPNLSTASNMYASSPSPNSIPPLTAPAPTTSAVATDLDLSDMSCSFESLKQVTSKRPSLAGTSTSSVKNKIRELEERVRAAEGY